MEVAHAGTMARAMGGQVAGPRTGEEEEERGEEEEEEGDGEWSK